MPEPTPSPVPEPTRAQARERAEDAGAGVADGEGVTFEELTFEELVAELEQVTETLAAGEVGIEAAAELYERARILHALASERLARVQERVDRISRD